MKEQDEEDAESAEGGAALSSELRGAEQTSYGSPGTGVGSSLTNGYHHHQLQQRHQEGRGLGSGAGGDRSPKEFRTQDMVSNSSPK